MGVPTGCNWAQSSNCSIFWRNTVQTIATAYLCDINVSLGLASLVQEFLDKLECLGVEEVLNNGVFWLKEGYIVLVHDARIVQYNQGDYGLFLGSGSRACLGVVMINVSHDSSWPVMTDTHSKCVKVI